MVVRSRSVSANHAVIEARADGLVTLRDRGSRNGTFVNDTHLNGNGVAEAHAALVRTGDYVRFGYDVDVYQYCAAGESLQPQREPQRAAVSCTESIAVEPPHPEPAPPPVAEPEPEPPPPPPPEPAHPREMVDAEVETLKSSTDLDEIRAEISRAAESVRGEIQRHSDGFIEELARQSDRTRDVLSKTNMVPEPEPELAPPPASLPPVAPLGASNWLPKLTAGDLKHRTATQPNPLLPLSLPRAVTNRPPPLPHLQRMEVRVLPAPTVAKPAQQSAAASDPAPEPGPRQPSAQAKEIFDQLDADGDGLIGSEELRQAVEQLGMDTDDAQVVKMLEQADADGDGKISLQEFAEVEEISVATRGSKFREAVRKAQSAFKRASRAAEDARTARQKADSVPKHQVTEERVRPEAQQALEEAEQKALADARAAAQTAKDLHAKRVAAAKAKTFGKFWKKQANGNNRMPTPISASASADSVSDVGSGVALSISIDGDAGDSQQRPQQAEPVVVAPRLEQPRRLSSEFNFAEAAVADEPSVDLSAEMSHLTGISADSLPALHDTSTVILDTREDLATSAALQKAIERAEAAAAASEKAARDSAAGHRQAELAAAWIKAELDVVQVLETESPAKETEREIWELKERLLQVERERDAFKARASRYKSEIKKVQHQGSSERKMIQDELDDANRMIAAAMSGDTDGVVEEMKQQRDEALARLDTMQEERDALVLQVIENARGQQVPVPIVDAAKDEMDPESAVLQAVLQLQGRFDAAMQSPPGLLERTLPPPPQTSEASGTCAQCRVREAELSSLQTAFDEATHQAEARAAEQLRELDIARAEVEQLTEQLRDTERPVETTTAGDTSGLVADMKKQLADANGAATAAQNTAAENARALAEVQKLYEVAAAEVSNLQYKLQAATVEVEEFRGAAEELRALGARRAETSPRETQTSPEHSRLSVSPRATQTSPEKLDALKPMVSPRGTQTSPFPSATQTKWMSLADSQQILVDPRATHAQEVFQKLDADGDGLIDGEELKQAVQELQLDTDHAKVAPLVERTTAPDDGAKVTLEELIEMAAQPADTDGRVSPSTVNEGDRVQIYSAGKWIPAVVENVNRDTGEAEVRFTVESPPIDPTDALIAELAAAQRELEEYRIAAAKLPPVAVIPTVVAPSPIAVKNSPLVPRLENLPPPDAATPEHPVLTDAPGSMGANTATGVPPVPTPRSTGQESAALKQMQDQMSAHFIDLKNQVEKLLAVKEHETTQRTEKATTPRDTQTSPEPTMLTTPRDTQTSPLPQATNTPRSTQTSPETVDKDPDMATSAESLKPVMSPRETQTTPEQKPAVSPRETQTTPEPEPEPEPEPVQVSSPSQRAAKVFQQMDTDGDGLIDGNELRQAVLELGMDTSHTKVAPLIERTAADDGARVSLEEFIAIARPDTLELSVHEAELRRLQDALEKHGLELDQMRAASAEQAEKLRVATESLATIRPELEAVSRSKQELQHHLDVSRAEAQQLSQQLKDAEGLLQAATAGGASAGALEMQNQLVDAGAGTAELEALKAQAARDKAALDAANVELADVREELDRLLSEVKLSDTTATAAGIRVPKLVGIPGSRSEPVLSPPREWRSPNSTMRSPERTPPRLRWTPRGEQAKKMEDRLKAQLQEQREQTEKLHIQLAETETLIDAAMAGHTDQIIKTLHDQLKTSRDEAFEHEVKAQQAREEAAEAQRRMEAQLTRIANLEANQLVHTDGQTQTSNGDVVIKTDDYVRLDRAVEAVQTGVSRMQKQCAEALRDLAVWRATAAGQDPRSASITQFEFDSFGSSGRNLGLADRLEQLIVPALTRVPLDTLQRTLADVIREHQERDSHDINSMPWSVLRDYAVTQRQRVEALSDENRSLTQRWADEHNDPSTAAAQVASLRSQLACRDAELYAIRGDLARFLHPTSASKDDGNDELTGDDGHRQKLAERYQKVVQAERALEERTRREHTARRKWSGLLQERALLAQQVQTLEAAVQKAEKAHAQAAAHWDTSMMSTRLELAHIAAGGAGDPRRQAAELLVAQLHTADRAVSEAQSLYREEARRAARLEIELAALRQAEGLTAWGDGVAAQREHMAALRDEIMELRTLLGPGHVEESTARQQLNGPQVLSVQDLQRLCQSYFSQLESKEKLIAAMESERARLKEGAIESTETGAIDHYTPVLASCEAETAGLRKALDEVTASRDAMAKRHPPVPGTAAVAPGAEDCSEPG